MSKQPFIVGQQVKSKIDHAGIDAGTTGTIQMVEYYEDVRRWWIWVRMPSPNSVISSHTNVGYWASECKKA